MNQSEQQVVDYIERNEYLPFFAVARGVVSQQAVDNLVCRRVIRSTIIRRQGSEIPAYVKVDEAVRKADALNARSEMQQRTEWDRRFRDQDRKNA